MLITFASTLGVSSALRSSRGLSPTMQSLSVLFIGRDSAASRSLFAEIRLIAAKRLDIDPANFFAVYVGSDRTDLIKLHLLSLNLVKPNLVLTVSTQITQAASSVLRGVPLVFSSHLDPTLWLQRGEHPNLTGFTYFVPTLGKRIELLRKLSTSPMRKIAIIGVEKELSIQAFHKELSNENLRAIGIEEVTFISDRFVPQLLKSVTNRSRDRIDGFIVADEASFYTQRKSMIDYFNKSKIPVVFPHVVFARSGGLASFSQFFPDYALLYFDFIRLILAGVAPAEIPIVTPKNFYLCVNSASAKLGGFKLPNSLLKSANEVIV
jgi:putative tryptophan/tyrosine transport system substrate-binding protein